MTLAHWMYLIVVLAVVVAMVLKRGVVLITTLGIFVIGLAYKGTLVGAVQTVFNAFLSAGTDLFDIMLIIALMVAMLKSMENIGADYLMVAPVRKILKTPTISFFTIGIVMYASALFFWPTPSTALVGTILIPIAIKSGLPAMAAAMSVNILGHGMALSGDLVLQGAPAITSGAAGVDVSEVLNKGGILSIIAGITAIIVAYFMVRREIAKGVQSKQNKKNHGTVQTDEKDRTEFGNGAGFIAIAVPVVFISAIIAMIILKIKGGDSTALLGGIAALFLILISLLGHGNKALEELEGYLKQGFLFSMKIFSTVIPIAGFFFLGSPDNAQVILGEGAPGFLFDLGQMFSNAVPLSAIPVAFGILIVGIVTGLDGSGFSGLPLVGALAKAIGGSMGVNIATLAAIGQIGAIWSGGGTLTAWAFGLVATAGVAGVSPMELARKNFIPVITGLIVATIVGIFML